MRAAGDDATGLPKDPGALRALLLQAWRERDGVVAERDRAARERDRAARERDRAARERDRAGQERERVERERDDALARNGRLLALLAKLRRMRSGRRSERLPEDRLHFAFEEIAATPSTRSRKSCDNAIPRRVEV